eukprot:SAG11_NODE_34112_length_273_cov_2.660920_1_plen_54_part_10
MLLPYWPSRPWWPTLMRLVDSYFELPALHESDIIARPCCVSVPEPLRNRFWRLG